MNLGQVLHVMVGRHTSNDGQNDEMIRKEVGVHTYARIQRPCCMLRPQALPGFTSATKAHENPLPAELSTQTNPPQPENYYPDHITVHRHVMQRRLTC